MKQFNEAAMIMKISAKKPLSPMSVAAPMFFVSAEKPRLTKGNQAELLWLRFVLQAMFYIHLVVAIACFTATIYWPQTGKLMMSSALLVVLASIAIAISQRHIRTSGNWVEICLITVFSVYAPFLVLWIAISNLLAIFLL